VPEAIVMNIRSACGAAAVLLAMLPARAKMHEPPVPMSRPNILLIVADDLGFSDLGCYGGEIETPNLDALAKNGLRFTQFYNTARCWPSRAGILTGYYAQQVRRDTVPGIKSGAQGNRPGWARLLPDMLRPLGYRSYHSGKWHLDGLPLQNGFDRSYSLNDHDRHFYPRQHTEDDKPLPPVQPNSGYYSSTAIADHAIKCLQDHVVHHSGQPFLEYLAFTSPHFPVQAPQEDIARYRRRYDPGWDVLRDERWRRMRKMHLGGSALSPAERDLGPPYPFPEDLRKLGRDEVNRPIPWKELSASQRTFQSSKMEIHAAMVSRMDHEIGRVVEQIRSMRQLDDTLILFLSDNGASAEMMVRGDGHDPTAEPGSGKTFLSIGPGWSTMCNTPFRRHKTWVHEGGISTPLIVHWPKGLKAKGEMRNTPAHIIDLVPTILAACGGKAIPSWNDKPVPSPPGKSLIPLFSRDSKSLHDSLWWLHEDNRALRAGNWKIVAAGKDSPWELYDLTADRSESHNLASDHPDKVRELAAIWERQFEEYAALALKD
jgi:arylsulfatase